MNHGLIIIKNYFKYLIFLIKKKNNIFTVKIIKENIFLKLFSVFVLFFHVYRYLRKVRVKILIIEGASWIGYSFIIITLSKIFFNKIYIIYKGHSVEYEIRKKNYFIGVLSFLFEKYVYKVSDIKTSVSVIEAEKIFKFYGVKPIVFPNIIKINNSIKDNYLKISNLPNPQSHWTVSPHLVITNSKSFLQSLRF